MTQFPDASVHNAIISSFSGLGLSLHSLDVKYSSALKTNDWFYTFISSKSNVTVTLTICYPETHLCNLIIETDQQNIFLISEYFKFIKDDSLEMMKKEFYDDGREKLPEYIFHYLKFVRERLTTDLKKVVQGEEWIKVPIDWSIAGR